MVRTTGRTIARMRRIRAASPPKIHLGLVKREKKERLGSSVPPGSSPVGSVEIGSGLFSGGMRAPLGDEMKESRGEASEPVVRKEGLGGSNGTSESLMTAQADVGTGRRGDDNREELDRPCALFGEGDTQPPTVTNCSIPTLMGEVVNVIVAFAVIVLLFRWVTSGKSRFPIGEERTSR
jgi:hypothetical protein